MIYNYRILKQDDFELWSHLKKTVLPILCTIYNFGLDIHLSIQNQI